MYRKSNVRRKGGLAGVTGSLQWDICFWVLLLFVSGLINLGSAGPNPVARDVRGLSYNVLGSSEC